MAKRSGAHGIVGVTLGAVERRDALWGFTFSSAGTAVGLWYREQERARRARLLMFEATSDAVWPVQKAKPGEAAAAPHRTSDHATHTTHFRQWTHDLLEEGQMEGAGGRLVEASLVALIVANVLAVALETIPSISQQFGSALSLFERGSLFIYAAEYVLRLWSCVEDPRIGAKGAFRGRLGFALRPLMIVDFLAFAPGMLGVFFGIDLRVLRIFRLFRLLKLARYSQALQALLNVLYVERSALLASAILLLAFTCLTGELMHLAEGAVQPKALGTMPGAMYWALTTLTTVGYGDIAPQTALGKIIASATMIAGLALFSLPVGIIANGFVTGLSRRRFAITLRMLRKQPLFEGFDSDSITEILGCPTASVIREHAHLTVAGNVAGDFCLIVSGFARVETFGNERALGPGDMVGIEALDHQARYFETVIAETEMRVLAFPGDELRRLCRKFPLMREKIEAERDHRAGSGQGTAVTESPNALEEEVARLCKLITALMADKAGQS